MIIFCTKNYWHSWAIFLALWKR